MSEKDDWKPRGARLILRRVNEHNGLIIMPDSAKQASMMCEVVACGATESEWKEGERVLIGRYSGYDVPVLDRDYSDCIIVNEADILCFSEQGEH